MLEVEATACLFSKEQGSEDEGSCLGRRGDILVVDADPIFIICQPHILQALRS